MGEEVKTLIAILIIIATIFFICWAVLPDLTRNRMDCVITNKGHTAICNGIVYHCEGKCLVMEVGK